MSKATIFSATVEGLRTTKKGYTITLLLNKQDNDINNVVELMKLDKLPVKFALKPDSDKIEEEEGKISEKQRKAIYKLLNVIGEHYGLPTEDAKETFKQAFCKNMVISDFSLSDVEKQTATDFIQFLVELGISEGLNLFEWIKDETETLCNISVKYKKCIICGNEGNVHHLKAIGMGNNRKDVDDSNYNKVCLCTSHHNEIHTIGLEKFNNKYHLKLKRG